MFWNCYRRCEFPSRTRCSQVAVLSLSSPNRVVNGRVGRPKYDIKEETLIELRSLGFSWEDIARMLLVSRWTIHRRVSEFGLNHLPRFSDVTDEQLNSKVSAFLREHGCLVSSSMVLGHLRSEGLIIQRERVRKCLARVDPQNVRKRWAITGSRRAYSVAGPNSLWHLNGHHSLVNWGFVIHDAIDVWPSCTTQQTTEVIQWGTCFWMQPRCMDGHPECEQIMVERIGKFSNWWKREELVVENTSLHFENWKCSCTFYSFPCGLHMSFSVFRSSFR